MPFFDWLTGGGYMPEAPNRICDKVGCPNVVPHDRRLCDLHRLAFRRNIDRARGPGSKRGAGLLRPGLAGWIARRANYLCQLCGMVGSEVDHIVPSASGGKNDSGNLQFVCRPCHQLKTAQENAERTRAHHKSSK